MHPTRKKVSGKEIWDFALWTVAFFVTFVMTMGGALLYRGGDGPKMGLFFLILGGLAFLFVNVYAIATRSTQTSPAPAATPAVSQK